jgi:hypothetical protein
MCLRFALVPVDRSCTAAAVAAAVAAAAGCLIVWLSDCLVVDAAD